jgi:1,3-beta-glucanosyltransferase GAS1
LKEAIRDVKLYIKSKGYRNIPVGFSDRYSSRWPALVREYLTCLTDSSEGADFFAVRMVTDCIGSQSQPVGYFVPEVEKFANMSSNSTIPVLFSNIETTCPNRTYAELDAVFDEQLAGKTLSGAFLTWDRQGRADKSAVVSYGDVVVGGNETYYNPTMIMPEYENLQQKWLKLHPTGVKMSEYSPKLTPPACPVFQQGLWTINGSVLPLLLGRVFDGNRQGGESGLRGTVKKGEAALGDVMPSVLLLNVLLFICIIL